MYRISIVRNPSAKGVYTSGYFGPCFKEDAMSKEELAIFKDPSQYVEINDLLKDPSRRVQLKQIISDANIGNYRDWARFRFDKKYVLQLCEYDGNTIKRIHFLRPEYAAFLNLPNNGPAIITDPRSLLLFF